MKNILLEILQIIELEKKYVKLCNDFSNFEKRLNLKRRDVEELIKVHDQNFKYVPIDRVFLSEMLQEDYNVRFILGFRGGIVDFSYLIWKQNDNENYHSGRLASLAELINPDFDKRVKYKTPIATSIDDYIKILDEIFQLFKSFKRCFAETTKD